MRVFGLTWQFQQRFPDITLSGREQERLRVLTLWRETRDVGVVCRTFGISRATLYRWAQQFDPHDPTSVRVKSRRPRRVRQPTWTAAHLEAVRHLRAQYPRWGKAKLAVLLEGRGYRLSASTVGRMLAWLKAHGHLVEPRRHAISARKRRPPRPYAVRNPADYRPTRPGDLVQVDTLDVRPVPGVVLKQFTARDVVSRWDVVEVHERATARVATQFLDTLQARVPFAVRAIQVDGGSEFFADFEAACQQRQIRLFALPPRSPKLNGKVERAQRTHTEEFYEVTPCAWTVAALNPELRRWEHTYNTIRPHQALAYRTPLQFLYDHGIIPPTRPSLSHM